MRARLAKGVRLRAEEFGGVCYVSRRDDFFAANDSVYRAIGRLGPGFAQIHEADEEGYRALARLGICETDPATAEESYSGASFLGVFPEIPTVSLPLVVNCFVTAHCPLECIYCHADDLMRPADRQEEGAGGLRNTASTTALIPAMVAVVTGGDPLTRPERARYLIERIGTSKGLVLDTSGVGDINHLMDLIGEFGVHVRVSLDSADPQQNRRFRPEAKAYGTTREDAEGGALRTIRRCVEAGVPTTVQTVVTSRNDEVHRWRELRSLLVGEGIRHWVMHVAVRGGKVRRVEDEARRHHRRYRGILPAPHVHEKLWEFVRETQELGLGMDIRCTDTANTPNSVLLVDSVGNLRTEGLAKHGKVLLYSALDARPDRVHSLMTHLDRFGHARRYLNWNPWFHDGEDIEKICYQADFPTSENPGASGVVETEAKVPVLDVEGLRRRLREIGFVASGAVIEQRDEYYDDEGGAVGRSDFVVRLRVEGHKVHVALKGPRFFSATGENSRLEFEVPAGPVSSVREAFRNKGLRRVWFLEKRRSRYVCDALCGVVMFLDEVPTLGSFVEIEGPLDSVRMLRKELGSCVGLPEARNYKELVVDKALAQGEAQPDGAEF